VDPLADHPNQIDKSPYTAFWNNPIKYNDPDGRCPDCPNGKYQVQKGDNFWDLERKWNMPQGSLAVMNKGVDPTKLQIGQTINTTLSKSDLPAGVTLHSSSSMNGMDGFFKKGAEGVNRIINISERDYDKFVNNLANVSKGGISENTTGGNMDAKMKFLMNKEQYSADTKTWFKEQTSVTEPNTRALIVYKGIGYNINEFGNLSFGSAKAINGVSLNVLIGGGHIYSILNNGKMDDPNEVKAIKRGYGYYKK
jgi:LysM repeat protein